VKPFCQIRRFRLRVNVVSDFGDHFLHIRTLYDRVAELGEPALRSISNMAMQNSMLNFACNPFWVDDGGGRGHIVIRSYFHCGDLGGLTLCFSIKRAISVMRDGSVIPTDKALWKLRR